MELKLTKWSGNHEPTESELVQALENEGYAVYVADDEPSRYYEHHTHPNDEVFVVVAGETIVGVGYDQIVMGPGDRLDIPANTLHWAANGRKGPIRNLGAGTGNLYDASRSGRTEESRARP